LTLHQQAALPRQGVKPEEEHQKGQGRRWQICAETEDHGQARQIAIEKRHV
jgi:hypothetical protein